MNIEKLIERLYKHHTDWGEGRTQDFFEVCLDCKDAATALSTLQAENERLRAELENYRKGHCSEGGCAAEKDRDLVIAENEKLRDAAEGMRSNWYKSVEEIKKLRAELERMKRIMRDNGIMTIPSKYPGGPTEWNIPKPRGRKED